MLTLRREGSLGVAKQLAFDESFRKPRAVGCYHRTIAARAPLVNQLRHNFFARAAFAANDHRCVGRGHDGHRLDQATHGSALAHEPIGERMGKINRRGRFAIRQSDRVNNRCPQFVQVDRFRQVIISAAFHRGHCLAQIRVSRDQQHGQVAGDLTYLGKRLDATHPRQADVEQNHLWSPRADAPEGLFGGSCLFDAIAERFDESAQ